MNIEVLNKLSRPVAIAESNSCNSVVGTRLFVSPLELVLDKLSDSLEDMLYCDMSVSSLARSVVLFSRLPLTISVAELSKPVDAHDRDSYRSG